eukprot:625736-Pyramimonas_sp.AAC.1
MDFGMAMYTDFETVLKMRGGVPEFAKEAVEVQAELKALKKLVAERAAPKYIPPRAPPLSSVGALVEHTAPLYLLPLHRTLCCSVPPANLLVPCKPPSKLHGGSNVDLTES